MVQIIEKPGSIAGRIGRGLGKGLSDQLPKEVERYRLSEGLKNFSQNSANLSPLEQYSQIAAIPGITPSMMQALPEILKQQNYAQALTQRGQGRNEGQNNENVFPQRQTQQQPPQGSKSITTTGPVKATIENYIPKSYDQILDRAGELFNQNPGLFKNDPQNAVQAATQEDQQNQAINSAQQNKRSSQQDVQSRVQNELKTQAQNAGVEIPDNVYSDIEDRAIEAVNSGKMTELEAGKHFKKELDAISRDYKSLETVGSGKLLTRTASGNKASLRSIREKFKERNDLENLADSYIAKNGLSPSKAYYLAYPVSDIKDLNNYIVKLPELEKVSTMVEDVVPPEISRNKTMEIAPNLAKRMGKEGSPLAISEELKTKGYDPETWLEYVDKNRRKLDLSARQERELDKPKPGLIPNLNDLWMFMFSGLDKLVEQ